MNLVVPSGAARAGGVSCPHLKGILAGNNCEALSMLLAALRCATAVASNRNRKACRTHDKADLTRRLPPVISLDGIARSPLYFAGFT
jgi:hypothetical protein